jgi:hypothetical protein
VVKFGDIMKKTFRITMTADMEVDIPDRFLRPGNSSVVHGLVHQAARQNEQKFNMHFIELEDGEPITGLLGFQPAPNEYPVAGLTSFEVYEDIEMGCECHPEIKTWIPIFKEDIEKPIIIPKDN